VERLVKMKETRELKGKKKRGFEEQSRKKEVLQWLKPRIVRKEDLIRESTL